MSLVGIVDLELLEVLCERIGWWMIWSGIDLSRSVVSLI